MPLIYISLGSNGGDPVNAILSAIKKIVAENDDCSFEAGSFYKTEPQGKTDQPWFVNTAIAIEVGITPEEALAMAKRIEREQGRVPGERWGAREIDIDIIFYDDIIMNTEKLTIPHKQADKRRFVLQPICDISPDVVHPTLEKSVKELLDSLPKDGQETRRIVS
ncbi:MAG TPA: 2-amino-4-hydroxy-6-hydroxymethyldihydropteridine diphosphokinase [Nitrospinota bacterium]|nr:2-amino-4-hydroxy-6-hydroxymethyldihydropteridine diphosphokinase [Nitrospinota bacterium]|tara:strand:- start:58013 stop:58504 length:492 start_codon:yes stop_codon:yes gene_type:complete